MKQPLFVLKNRTHIIVKKYTLSIAIQIWVALLFLSCQNNNIDQIKAFSHPPGAPEVEADTFVLFFTDSSVTRFRLETPKLLMYEDEEEPYQEYPKGFLIQKFDNQMRITSSVKASYGKYFDKKGLWEAKQNVVALTENGDSLLTEHLFWDEKKHLIYSDIFVKVIRPDEVLMGIGFESDEQILNWKFEQTKGHFYIEVDKE